MRYPRLVAVAIGLALLGVPIGVGMHHPGVLTSDANLAASTLGQHTYSSWKGAGGFDAGTHEGTSVVDGELVMGSSIGTTSLGGRSWQTARWTSTWATPAHSFTELVPSCNAATPTGTLIQVRLRAKATSGAISSFDTIATWTLRDGEFERTSYDAQTDDFVNVNVDTLRADSGQSLRAWQMQVLLLRQPGKAGPRVTKVGGVASQIASSLPATSTPLYGARTLDVPRLSQMIHRGEYPAYGGGGEAWCSPTSTSMVMAYYGRRPPRSDYTWVDPSYRDRYVDHAARRTFDFRYDGTGNWPFNTAYAAHYVDDAFVTRMATLRDAERFVHAGIPVVASISFDKGQLSGAPISATSGHLVVIVGFTAGGNVVVNDPAAPDNATVRRTYDRGQLERAWLRRSAGLAYVIRDDAHPLPARDGHTNW
jgi:hypothetical protein